MEVEMNDVTRCVLGTGMKEEDCDRCHGDGWHGSKTDPDFFIPKSASRRTVAEEDRRRRSDFSRGCHSIGSVYDSSSGACDSRSGSSDFGGTSDSLLSNFSAGSCQNIDNHGYRLRSHVSEGTSHSGIHPDEVRHNGYVAGRTTCSNVDSAQQQQQQQQQQQAQPFAEFSAGCCSSYRGGDFRLRAAQNTKMRDCARNAYNSGRRLAAIENKPCLANSALATSWSSWGVLLSASLFSFCLVLPQSQAFNVDVRTAKVYSKDPGSMFGFSVAQYKDGRGQDWILVGAPKAQTDQRDVTEGGAVYQCGLADYNCQQVPMDATGNSQEWDGSKYVQTENKTGQWFGATLKTAKNSDVVVACAPRYVYFARSGARREPVGTCYVANTSLTRFREYSPCRTAIDDRPGDRYGRGTEKSQSGFAAVLADDGSYLGLGGVGSYYWQGQLFTQSLSNYRDFHETSESGEEYDDSYMGYALGVGDFNGDGVDDFAVGVPRGNELLGRVTLYTRNVTSLHNISGEQLGEYFGMAIAVGDFNGDSLADIAIGAPFYKDPTSQTYEIGRVAVFYQTPQHSFRSERTALSGEKTSGSRFGLAITTLGDINDDGYNDLGVGAPYGGDEGLGVIYLFHGSSRGVMPDVSQVIHSEDVGPSLENFGYSLHGGLDQDANAYPDMVVGAYNSDSVVFLRSRPIIRVETDLKLEPQIIDLRQKKCNLTTGVPVACFSVVTCMRYTGRSTPDYIDLTLEWGLDTVTPREPRAFYMSGSQSDTTHQMTMRLKLDTRQCRQQQVYVRPNIRDKKSPMIIELVYALVQSPPLPGQLTPLLDAYIPQTVRSQAQILKNCGTDNVCITDLRIAATTQTRKYIFGTSSEVDVTALIENLAEDAHEAQVWVVLPQGVRYINVHKINSNSEVLCTSRKQQQGGDIIKCDIGNPLPARETVSFTIRTFVEGVNTTLETLTFSLRANSTSHENKTDLHDNRDQLLIPMKAVVEISMTGVSKPEQILYNATAMEVIITESDIGPEVIHLYEVRNVGPSNIKDLHTVIYWPAETASGLELFYLPELPQFTTKHGQGKCVADWVNPRNITVDVESYKERTFNTIKEQLAKKRSKRESDKRTDENIFELKCQGSDDRCRAIICETGFMEKDDSVVIEVRSRVWIRTILQFRETYRGVYVASQAVSQVIGVPYNVEPEEYSADQDQVETYVAALFQDPGKQPLSIWVIALAIIGGSLLLLLLVLLLYKCGFFERKKHEDEEGICNNGGVKEGDPSAGSGKGVNSDDAKGVYSSVPDDEF